MWQNIAVFALGCVFPECDYMPVGNRFLQPFWPATGDEWDVGCYLYHKVSGSNVIPGGL